MAGAILSSIIKWMLNNKLPNTTKGSSGFSSSQPSSVQEDLTKLERTLLRIQAVLSDAEEREIRDKSVKLWLKELKSLAHDAEDALDDYGYEILQAKVERGGDQPWPSTGKRKRDEVHDLISTSLLAQVSVPDRIVNRIKEIRMRFDEIAEGRKTLCLREDDGDMKLEPTAYPPPTSPYQDESKVFGREDDKKKLMEWVVPDGGSGGENFSVIPVIGMGGIGKTTLVRLVYNDPKVCQYFNLRVWICVSIDFDVIKLIRGIIQSITKETCDLMELSALQKTLKEELKGKKLLLVLDDVWNEKIALWDCLRVALIGGGRCKIIVTTRNVSVAQIMQTMLPYRLGGLLEDQCWLLFQRFAFEGRDPNANAELVEIGKKIVPKCGGLPLAVKALGGLLCFEIDAGKWEDILESDLWELDEEEKNILPALKLSYHRMPTRLKPCFMYCSLFPKNYLFKKEQLIKLWMAQGLIQHRENRRVEDIGRQYFDDLLRRSFFQYSPVGEDDLPQTRSALQFSQVGNDDLLMKSFFHYSEIINGDERMFVIHDLIHDLAQSVAEKECLMVVDEKLSDVSSEARHLSLIPKDSKAKTQLLSFDGSRVLRTILYINRSIDTWDGNDVRNEGLLHANIPKDQFSNFKCLRTLDMSYTDIKELPDSIGELKHLCYLGLQGTGIRSLPESICRLYFLQTLGLQYCRSLRELPKGIGKLINLRHLELPLMDYASSATMPSGIGNLTSLQTLPALNVGRDSTLCGIRELKDLMNLRGGLSIAGLQNVANGKDAKEANLKDKEHLQTLTLKWSARGRDQPGSSRAEGVEELVVEGVIESLQPHTNLVQLIVRGYGGTRFPTWMCDPSFSKLTSVTISQCPKCKFLPPFGRLPSLKVLLVGKMEGVQCVGPEFYGRDAAVVKAFQSLETLDFEWMQNWEEWSGVEEGDFPRLKRLVIKHCPKLNRLPHHLSESLKQMEIEDFQGFTAIPNFSSLISLDLGGKWNDLAWSSSSSVICNLQSMEISWSENLKTLLLHGSLYALKELEIGDCSQLSSIVGLHDLPSLQRLVLRALPELRLGLDDQLPSSLQFLDVVSCVNLRSIPLHHHLSALKELMIQNCPQITLLVGLKNLASLESLEIILCPELRLAPYEELPSALQSFTVSCCDNLRSLPLLHQNLSALKELKIESCPKLGSVVGLHNLSSLELLEISDCSELQLQLLPNEQLPSSILNVDISDCPGLIEWCQTHGIKHAQNEFNFESNEEDFDDEVEDGDYHGEEDEGEENWEEQGPDDDID